MTQENKELLLKDLCARLPYNVVVEYSNIAFEVLSIDKSKEELTIWLRHDYHPIVEVENVKPYLFPLSSISEEQRKYISDRWGINENFNFEIDPNWGKFFVDLGDTVGFIDWLHENHFDYRGLIPKGLAVDATGLNVY